jgi:hypothetical protein
VRQLRYKESIRSGIFAFMPPRIFSVLALSAVCGAPALAQENRLSISGNVNTGYDSNILRTNERAISEGPQPVYIVEPTLGIDYSRQFGRQRIFLDGTAGYSFHDRYKFLDRETVNLNSGANIRFGGRCQIDPTARLLIAQSDLENLGQPVKNTVKVQDYAVSAYCPNPVGLFPRVSGFLTKTDNSLVRRNRDQTVYGGEFAIVYRRPSLGDLEANYTVTKVDRFNRTDLTGFSVNDNTTVTNIGIGLTRSVATRLSGTVRVGYTHANPASNAVSEFSGISWSASATYEPTPRIGVTLSGNRGISASGNTGSSYYVNTGANVSARYKVSARTNVSGNVGYSKRDYRGEDRYLPFGQIGQDKVLSAGAGLGYRLNRRVGLDLRSQYRSRDADNEFYNYSTWSATLGVSVLLRR